MILKPNTYTAGICLYVSGSIDCLVASVDALRVKTLSRTIALDSGSPVGNDTSPFLGEGGGWGTKRKNRAKTSSKSKLNGN